MTLADILLFLKVGENDIHLMVLSASTFLLGDLIQSRQVLDGLIVGQSGSKSLGPLVELVLDLRLRPAEEVVIECWDSLLEDPLNVRRFSRRRDVDVPSSCFVTCHLAGVIASCSGNWASGLVSVAIVRPNR